MADHYRLQQATKSVWRPIGVGLIRSAGAVETAVEMPYDPPRWDIYCGDVKINSRPLDLEDLQDLANAIAAVIKDLS